MGKQIKIEVAQAIKLDPEKNYLLLFDWTSISKDEAVKLQKALNNMGVQHAILVLVHGDPATAVKVVEDTPKQP